MGAAGEPVASSYNFSKVKLFIAIPTRGNPSIGFAESLAVSCCALTLAKAEISIFRHQANNFVDMSRNKLLAKFMQSDCTHIWFIDDDMGWNADAVLKMIACDKDFIAGIGPLKTDSGEDFACHLFSNPDGSTVVEPGPDYLMSAEYVGGAFLILKRETVQKMMDGYPDLASIAVDEKHGFSLFQSLYKPIWKTEDYVFCDRWRGLGGQIWCYPNISFTHQGMKDWSGNYFEYRVEKARKDPPKKDPPKKDPPDVPEPVRRLLCDNYIERICKSVENIESTVARIRGVCGKA